MVDDDSVGSQVAGLSTAQLELPIVSGHTGIDERQSLKPLRREWTPELLGRHFLLSETDMAEAKRSRGTENRLGFALTLLLIRFLNFVPASLEQVPEAVVDFVSSQVRVKPDVLVAYGKRRPQTRDDHAKRIRRYLGVRAFVASDGEALLDFLIERAMRRDDPTVLLDEAEEWLRRDRLRGTAGAARNRGQSSPRCFSERAQLFVRLAQGASAYCGREIYQGAGP